MLFSYVILANISGQCECPLPYALRAKRYNEASASFFYGDSYDEEKLPAPEGNRP